MQCLTASSEQIRESGFDVLEQMERIFAPEEVQELYSSMKEEVNDDTC